VQGHTAIINVGIGHANYGRVMKMQGASIAGERFAHLGRCLPGMQPADQNAVFDQVVLAHAHAFGIVTVGA